MKKIESFLSKAFLCLIVILLFSCTKEPQKELSFSVSNIELESSGTAQAVNITANVDWNITVANGSWLSVSPKSGNSSIPVQISSQPNISGESRTATLTLQSSADNNLKAALTVIQVPVTLNFSPEIVSVKSEGESVTFNVISNTKWEILTSEQTARVTLSKTQGEGNASITANVTANPHNKIAEIPLKFSYYGIYKTLILKQEPGPNTPPNKPVITTPQNGATGVYTNVTFKWNGSDADGDTLDYYLMLSKDGSNFESNGPFTVREAKLNENLDLSTKYFVKIKADDKAGGIAESDVIEFTTASSSAYYDGEVAVYQMSTKDSPVKLVIVPDGYIQEDLTHGGQFDIDVANAVEGLFSVEPYKTYREYFSVYKVAAISKDRGVQIKGSSDIVNTAFSSVWEGGNSTGISGDDDKVFAYAQKVEGMTTQDLQNTSVCVLINASAYAGTCAIYSNGRSAAYVTTRQKGNNVNAFIQTFCHEYGGHGFGMLADEYQYYEEMPPQSVKDNLDSWHNWGYFLNVSHESEKTKVPWKNFIGKTGYEHVSVYTGAYLYKQGMFRSEEISCMWDNRLYFNAISRWMIVERLKTVAGETLTLEEFIANDKVKKDNTSTISNTKSNFVEKFIPLAPPILKVVE